MWWRSIGLVGVLLLVAACGGTTGRDASEPMTPNEVLEQVGHHRDQVEARWLVVEAELRQAELVAAQADKAKDPDHPSRATRYDSFVANRDLEQARSIQRRCEKRDGSKPCSGLAEIEAIVNEMANELTAD